MCATDQHKAHKEAMVLKPGLLRGQLFILINRDGLGSSRTIGNVTFDRMSALVSINRQGEIKAVIMLNPKRSKGAFVW
jgi:hypothetical protein